MTPGRSVVCPVLIGRAAQFDALNHLLEQACSGQGEVMLIAGEAGIGKSRLVVEVTAVASKQGFQVLQGTCFEHDRSLPYAAILDLLRTFLSERSAQETAECLGATGSEIAKLVPELGSLLPDLVPAPALSPEQEKRRLFHALAQFVCQLAAKQPVLAVFEDLHWSDETTLEFLLHLGRRIESHRILLLMTYRNDELHPALPHFLAEIDRQRLAAELVLDRLTQAEVDVMLRAILDLQRPVRREFLETIYRVTEGNPFFIEEVLKSLVAASGVHEATVEWDRQPVEHLAIPRTVQDAVRRRAAQLSPEARQLLVLAAVAGQRFDFTLLAELTQATGEQLVQQLKELVAAQLVVEESEERFSFRHALTRQAVYSQLLVRERQGLHQAIAETMERLSSNSLEVHLENLAYHYYEGGVWEKALDYCQRAGDAARYLHPNEALVHYQRALDAARALGSPRMAELDRRCGQCLALLGGFDAARQHLEAALQAARRDGDTALEQGTLYDLAGLYGSRDYRQGKQYAQQALALAARAPDPRLEALALNRLGNIYTNLLQMAEARALHEDALQRFQAIDDRWGVADCLDLIGMARYLGGEVAEARAAFAQAAAVFVELDDAERVASSLTSRSLYLAVLDGSCSTDAGPPACRADAEQGLRLCHDLGWRAGEAYALVAVACLDLAEGKHGEALRNAESALAIAREIDHQQWQVISLLTLGLIAADLLDHRRALASFDSALTIARALGSAQWTERLEAWVACCQGRLGDQSAASMLATLLRRNSQPTTIGQRRAFHALAEIELAQGHPEEALQLSERLLAGASGPRPAPLLLLRAEALTALGRRQEADNALLEARRLAHEFGPRSVLWRVAACRAQLWRRSNAAINAEETRLAHAEVSALANAIPEGDLRMGFLRAPEIRPWAGPAGRQRTAAAVGTPGGLTPRERDVVVCIAQGMSNKETARHLFIAEKTVEMHVSSSLAKLGFASRVQLAAWAVANGLIPAPRGQGPS